MNSNLDYIENLECDVLIIGSGGTGSQATQAVAEEGLNVIVISKKKDLQRKWWDMSHGRLSATHYYFLKESPKMWLKL